MHNEGNFTSLPDAGGPGQGIRESYFTDRPVSNCGIILLYIEKHSLKMRGYGQFVL